jgi:SAM-dependent methyltransferase
VPVVPLQDALAEIGAALLDPGLRRAVAAGVRRGASTAPPRLEVRRVELKDGPHLQLTSSAGPRPVTRNEPLDPAVVRTLLDEPYHNWVVEGAAGTLQLRVTKKGAAQLHRSASVAASVAAAAYAAHDRAKDHLLDPADPLYQVIGGSAAKRRQVDAFLRALQATLPPVEQLPQPLHVVDLGCGNAYLTFAAHRYLSSLGVQVRLTGVDVRDDQRERNTALAAALGIAALVTFVAAPIAAAEVEPAPDVVLALHACDTATDDALARAVRWGARWILAAPCCHHDIAAQLRSSPAIAAPYRSLVKTGILRERFADVLTDTLRAAILRTHGYRVEVVEFVDSQHTPRNLLLRATLSGAPATSDQLAEVRDLEGQWGVRAKLADLLS